jgi:hypothetical protein
MKSAAPRQREASTSIPAPSATHCANETVGQTLELQMLMAAGFPGAHGGFGDFQLRFNPFVSLFAASLIAMLPVHAVAQETDEPIARQEAVSVQDRERPEYTSEGRRLGTFVLNAALDLSVASTDNLFAAPNGAELDDIIYGVAPSARLESDWSRNMVALEAGAEFLSHEDFSNEDTDSHYIRALGRLDIGQNTALRASARTAHETTPRTDPDSPFVGAPVEYDRTDYSAGIEHRFARATVSFDAGQDEYDYDGSQNDRDNTQDFIRGRLQYDLSPRLGLVLRAQHDERDYTAPTVINADSENDTYMAGISINSDVMRGEVTAGVYERDYQDPMVDTLEGTAISGRLEWYITQLTTLTFHARQDADDEVSVSSRLPYEVTEYGGRVDHELRRNVILTASARLGERDYQVNLTPPRHDDYSEIEAGADWLLNRNAALRFRYERDEVDSSGQPASRDYEVDKVTVGMTLRL